MGDDCGSGESWLEVEDGDGYMITDPKPIPGKNCDIRAVPGATIQGKNCDIRAVPGANRLRFY